MKPPKHLVLDDDVHRALKRKKAEIGINLRDLGNCALRSVLDRPLLAEAIGRQLVEAGTLTDDEFEAIRNQALNAIHVAASDVASIVHTTKRQTLASGSWEIRELARDDTVGFQIVAAWVKDHRMRPFTLHQHTGLEFLVVLQGSVLLSVDLESQVLKAPGQLMIPRRAFHSATPLERETYLIAVIAPPEPGYAASSST